MSTEILCSTGTMVGRANGYNHRIVTENHRDIAANGFELMMLSAYYERLSDVIRDFTRADVKLRTIHFEKNITALLGLGTEEDRREGLRIFRINAETGRAVGAEKAVFHLWDGRFSPAQTESVLTLLASLYEICEECDLELMIENVPARVPSPYENVAEAARRYPSARFTFDTRHAHVMGQCETFLESPLWQRIGHIHVSDYNGETVPNMWGVTRPILHPGEGIIDFDAFFRAMPPYHGGTVTLESPVMLGDGSVDLPKLNASLVYLGSRFDKM